MVRILKIAGHVLGGTALLAAVNLAQAQSTSGLNPQPLVPAATPTPAVQTAKAPSGAVVPTTAPVQSDRSTRTQTPALSKDDVQRLIDDYVSRNEARGKEDISFMDQGVARLPGFPPLYTPNKDFTIHVGGFFQFENVWFRTDPARAYHSK